jgi:hypothetical protein
MVATCARRHPGQFAWLPHHFDRLIGSDRPRARIMESGGDPAALSPLVAAWEADAAAFRTVRARLLLY